VIDAPEKQVSSMGFFAKCYYINAEGTAMERLVMRPLTNVLVVCNKGVFG
jgi:hypothetical protein